MVFPLVLNVPWLGAVPWAIIPVTQPYTAPAAGPIPAFPPTVQLLTLPAGTGTVIGAPLAVNVTVEGITFNVIANVAAPPGRELPPAEPVPPAPFHTVVTGIENVSTPVKVGVGGVYT